MLVGELEEGVLDSGMYSLHHASKRAFARGELKRASRLACGSILLRSFFGKNSLDANGQRIATDETDFAILLNFFASSMLRVRAFLHKPKGDRLVQNLYVTNVLPHVVIYRALIKEVFVAIKCKTKFQHLTAELLSEPSMIPQSDYEHYCAMCEFHSDTCFSSVLRSCRCVASRTDDLTPPELAKCILSLGELLVKGTEQTIDNNGVAPIYAQQVLWRLLVAHDAHFAALFLGHRNKLLFQPEQA